MDQPVINQFIFTVKDRCKVCYTCVRECPAKAIKIINGQAEIIPSRCISCGNCVKVCSREAKMFTFAIDKVKKLLREEKEVAAIVAPSIAAEFTDISDYYAFVGMIRALGFKYVNEVAFGAELVAHKYQELLQKNPERSYISTSCPSIVNFVEKHHPQIIEALAPVVSPMVATAKVLKKMHGEDIKIVFIGPCIAKKGEAVRDEFNGLIDEVISFIELRRMFSEKGVTQDNVEPSDFDTPAAGRGAVFPISGGMLQTVNLEEDYISGEIVVAEGRQDIIEVLREFEEGYLEAKLFDLLCCNGCINGPGMSHKQQFFNKRKSISNFAKRKFDKLDVKEWEKNLNTYLQLDLSRSYIPDDQRFPNPPNSEEIRGVLKNLGKELPEDELNCGACGYDTCYDHAVAILKGIAETEMCLPYTIDKLHEYIKELDISNKKLESTQAALKQSEKLASMGQLAAGIAHEVNNPLGVVIMYSHILLDEVEENSPIHRDLKLIVEQADRCKKIVGGLLNFARKSKVSINQINVNQLVKDSLRTLVLPPNIKMVTQTRTNDPMVECDHDQMVQVFANLFKNAIDAMPGGGTLKVTIDDHAHGNEVQFEVSDSGSGISLENQEKMFEPFFTTKENGKGTGLGLPIIYGIVKMHRGNIKVESNNDPDKGDTGTTFFVSIPRKSASAKEENLSVA
ncbi:MAG: [Fe-Fe] hydrogenase large subunit C-terminal domain-containing protein [Bacteroidales bacterium]|jgi:iron only hydrogenase large subunit-like protein/nitrogen-specific signal transduction histidine kinase|nr:[Fe-Fe] hydrogenase large subunit C-terminal domain-containing protein [Bacteroidales bacterium]NLM91341.1 4Fe-4S dicluster domain-containing protein [Bacteroidales bacterium]